MQPVTPRQFGGTALFSIGPAAHRAVEKGSDASNLGRWTWTRYRGKSNHTLRVVTAYRPNNPNGPFTVYAQHNAFFHSIGSPRCPRKAFLQDLCQEIMNFLEAGDNIILMLDGNSNMRQSDLKSALENCSLKEAILSNHGMHGPATFRRNNTQTPIDGLWVSPNVNIKACGYFDYDSVFINTDHRCLWADISFTDAFGHTLPAIIRPKARRLHCKDPRIVANYVKTYSNYIKKSNLLYKVKKLKQISAYPLNELDKQTYEDFDSIRCEGVRLAEKKCRKLRKGQVAFSPQLQSASRRINAWSLLLKKAKGLKTSSRLLKRSLKKASIPSSARGIPRGEIEEELREAFQDYYYIKGSDKELRDSAQEKLAEAMAEAGNTTKETMIRVIRHREKQRNSARKIRFLRGKMKSGSTTMVTVNENGIQRDLTKKQEIEQAIMLNNMDKYKQSFHTPFMTSPLKEEFGFKGLTTAAQAVLGGVYEPSNSIDKHTKEFIEELEMPQAIRALGPQKMEIEVESFKNFWRKAKENTACYPDDLSFATMKAGATDEIISELECEMINIALKSGYSPERWRHLLDVMILKKSGNTQLASLRTICLFPVDCNYAFKHIGREMMKIAEATNSIAPEQYGSRRNHKAIDLAVNKAITYDLLRQLKRPGAICSNDARSCYDLIGHSQASMAMQRNGVPRPIIDCLFTTLQDARHQVRTGYGDSSTSYGGPDNPIPMHGIGQGNGAGPAIWAVLSSPLLNLLRSKGHGCEFTSPFSQQALQFVGYAFVDDTDIIVSQASMDSYIDASLTLQQAVDTWEGGLKATCGALVPEKTFWYLIDFSWSSGCWKYKSVDESPGSLWINDIEGIRKEVRRCEPCDAQETLGVFLAPDGNLRKQKEKLREAAITWADCMRTGRISRDDAWLSFYSTVWKTISYPLPALNITKEEYDKIMTPILQYLLPAMGVCRNFSRTLVYSSIKYMGLGIKHPHTVQEICRIKDILSHTYRRSTTGNLYRTSMELLLLEIGMGHDLQSISQDAIQYLSTDSLIKSTCQFLSTHNLDLRHDIKISPLRVDDHILMRAFYALQPSLEVLKTLNDCRLYLQVYFLSEICTGDGTNILPEAWYGKPLENANKNLSWPRQPRPGRKSWGIWQQYLKKAFLYRGLRLRTPLGDWLPIENGWEWYFSPSQNCLFQYHQGTWLSFSNVHHRKHLPSFSMTGKPELPPADLERATIYKNKNRIVCSGHSKILENPKHQSSSFVEYLAGLEIKERWCFDYLTLLDDGSTIAQAIQQGVAIAISDGSYQDKFGTASWVIEGAGAEGRIVGDVIAPGAERDHSAYRSELTGIYSILVCVKHICNFFKITAGSIELGCDGQSALDKAFNYVSIIRIDDPNYDLLFAIRSLWAHSPLQWTFRHVRGHQDDHLPIAELDRWSRLNIEMDSRAKSHMAIAKRSSRHYMLALEPWSIWIHGKKLIAGLDETIYDVVHSPKALEYWRRKDELTQEVITKVDWESIGVAMQEAKRHRRIFISKHVSGMCGVGKFMKRWKLRTDDACPRCGDPEDAAHVWRCQGEGANEIWDKAINDLEGWLNVIQTDPDLQHIITSYLRTWKDEKHMDPSSFFVFGELIQHQSNIGWRRFFEGWLCTDWALLQQAYYKSIKSHRSGKRWTIAVITKLWNIAWDLWEHRNGVLHNCQNAVVDREDRATNRKVAEAFNTLQSMLLPIHDRHLLSLRLARLLKKNTLYKEVWLRNANIVISSGRRNQSNQWSKQSSLQGMRRCMRQFLRRA